MLPWIGVVVCAAWLAVLRFPPSGTFQTTTVLDGKSAWIFPFLPGERVSAPGKQSDGWVGQRIISDPTYFTARAPGPYDSVDVSIEFRPLRQPLVEFGMVRNAEGTELELHPMFSSELDAPGWTEANAGPVHGYVRSGISSSRLADPDTRGLAIWASSSTMPLMQDHPGPDIATTVSLRGSHDIYLVPTDRVHVTFTLQPVNRNPGNDIVSFRVFRGDTEIRRESFDVSGTHETRMGPVIEHTIDIPDVSAGVYRISFAADDDVFIRKIVTPSARWVVGPRLVFGDVVGYSTTTIQVAAQAWTNSRHFVVETFHKEGLQTVSVATKHVTLKAVHTQMRIDRDDDQAGPVELDAPVGDVRIVGDGFFAFTPSAFFEPSPRRFSSSTSFDKEHINAIVTSYQRPQDEGGGWYRTQASFSLDPTLGQLRFVLSAPGALSRGAAVDIRRITLAYHRKAVTITDWMRILRQELANAWHRL
jgi:hypothetical protein